MGAARASATATLEPEVEDATLEPEVQPEVQLPPELIGPRADEYVLRPERLEPLVQEFRAMHNAALEHGRFLQDEKATLRHAIHLEQYRLAVENLRKAQAIPVNAAGQAQMTQFGTWESKAWRFHVPPGGVPSQERVEDWLIVGDNYRYMTSNPVHIAYLRTLVERRSVPGLTEMEVGLTALFDPKDGFAGWFDAKNALMAEKMSRRW